MPAIYLDYAAAAPLDDDVLAAMLPYFRDQFYNPSATYLSAVQVRKDIEAARALVASILGARAAEIFFTAGGTEANNLAIHGIMRRFPGTTVLVSAIEHESVLAAAGQYDSHLIPVQPDGIVDVNALEGRITEDTAMLSVMYANNEVGTIQPLREISQLIQKVLGQRRTTGNMLPLLFHTDAAQAGNYLDLHVSRLGVDLMTLNGGKIYGPKQSGALWIRSGIEMVPLVYGGGQERGLRSGTENVPSIIGFARALEQAQAKRHEEATRLQALQQLFYAQLAEALPQTVVNGSLKKRLPNNTHITIPGTDNERILMQLDEQGIMAAAGSACSASNEEPSHVLKAMGIAEADAQASLRFTMGRSTDEAAIRRTVAVLGDIVSKY